MTNHEYNENDLIDSPLSRIVEDEVSTLSIQIYRLPTTSWTLEIVNENGTSTVWDGEFTSDEEALKEALASIEESGGVTKFSAEADEGAKEKYISSLATKALIIYDSINDLTLGKPTDR